MSLKGEYKMKRIIFYALSFSCLTILLNSEPLYALNVQHFRPSTGAMKGYQVYTSDTLQQGQYSLGVVANYGQHFLRLRPPGTAPDQQIVDELLMLDYLVDVGIMDWWTLSIDMPMTAYHNIQQTPVSTADQGGAALGDLAIRMKFKIFDAEKTSSGLGLAFVPMIEIPTGQDSVFIGDNNVSGSFALVGDWQIHSNRFYLNAGYVVRPSETLPLNTLKVGDEVMYGGGFQRPLVKSINMDMLIELYGFVNTAEPNEQDGNPPEALFLMQHHVLDGKLAYTVGGGWGITEGYGTPRFRAILGVSYIAPPPSQEKPKPLAHIEEKRIVIDEKIHFEFDKATIRPESYPVLDAVVSVMQDHPDIKKVEVAGYTDSVGSDAYNERLSERRSKSVEAYLEQHGVESDRLVSKGYGESDPIATNETAEGRAMNRRTEFRILERD